VDRARDHPEQLAMIVSPNHLRLASSTVTVRPGGGGLGLGTRRRKGRRNGKRAMDGGEGNGAACAESLSTVLGPEAPSNLDGSRVGLILRVFAFPCTVVLCDKGVNETSCMLKLRGL